MTNHSKLIRTVAWLALLSGLFLLPVTTFAQTTTPGLTLSATAGYDGTYKQNHWVPVVVNAANTGPAIEGEIRVVVNAGSLNDRLVYRTPISLPTQSDKQVQLYVYLSGFTGDLEVTLQDDNGRTLASTPIENLNIINANTLLYGVLTSDPGDFGVLETINGRRLDGAVAFLDLSTLPETAVAWNMLDVVIMHDVDTGQLTLAQEEALNKWISTGGQLVIAGGANWQKTAVRFIDQLPVTISGSESIDDLPLLTETTGEPFRDPGPYVITRSSLRSGELLLNEGNLPILARNPQGRGAIYFLALDPAAAPLRDWDGVDRIWAEVANRVPDPSLWGAGPQNGYAANQAVTSIPALELPSLGLMGLLLLAYIIVVGPVNYLLLKRRNQLERAWFTIPLLVLVFSGAAYIVGSQLRGNNVIVNQMAVAYSQLGSDEAQVVSLIGLYSPGRSTYDLTFPAQTVARPFEENYGPTLEGNGSIDTISYGSEVTLENIRLDVSGIETFVARGVEPTPALSAESTLRLQGSNIRLDATIRNDSDIDLQTVSLLFGDTAILVGDLAAGETQTVSHVLSATAGATTPAPGSSGFMIAPVPGGSSPLSANAGTILNSVDYYDDKELYPRYQLLEALDSSSFGGDPVSLPTDVLVLLAWADQGLIEATPDTDSFNRSDTTLYFIELPIRQEIVSGTDVTLPPTLLNWSVLGSSGLYEPTIQDLYLNGGWVEFEFEPWTDFQTMAVQDLSLVLEAPDGDTSVILPDVRLWDWQEESWQVLDVRWGETAVADPIPYLGPGNTVRLRLQDNNAGYGETTQLVYPQLSGDLE